MKKHLLAIVIVTSFLSVSFAQQNLPLAQLAKSAPGISLPEAPLPSERGAALSHINSVHNTWDPAAPFSYYQKPAKLAAGAGVTLENVRWGRTPADHKSFSWKTVRINPDLIEKVIYGYKTFGTGHTLLIFVFKEGGVTDSRGATARVLTFGAEAWAREPYGYTLSHAFEGRYPLIWSATTFESYADYVVGFTKMEIFFRNMNISRAQTLRLFELLMARIDETNRNHEVYNMLSNSCTNNNVGLVNQVLLKNQRIPLESSGMINPSAAIPVLAVKQYEKMGVLRPEIFRVGLDNYKHFDILKI
ncbi:MAG TPA: hypothetical protein DCS63_00480 [Elusimicrobia bacterium]|nr:hypothetical protein [Elusimicrobiota bacterium]